MPERYAVLGGMGAKLVTHVMALIAATSIVTSRNERTGLPVRLHRKTSSLALPMKRELDFRSGSRRKR